MASFFRQCIVFTGFVDAVSANGFHHRGTTPWSEELRVLARRTLQAKQGSSGCLWTQGGCKASGAYYDETGAFSELDSLIDELSDCTESACSSANCKSIVGDQGDLCVNEASNMTQQLAAELRQLFAEHGTIRGFRIACPLSDSLDGGASQECKDQWQVLIEAIGCQSCKDDINFFTADLGAVCGELRDQGACESAKGTRQVGKAICDRASASEVESNGTQIACDDAAASDDSGGLSAGAIAGISIAAIVATVAIAALIVWAILRSPGSRSSKKRAAAANAVPQAPGPDPAAHAMLPPAPYGAQGMPSDQYAGHYYAQGQQVMPGAASIAEAPASVPRMVPTDVYPSAEQFMASGQDSHFGHGGSVADGSFYGSMYGSQAPYGTGAGSVYGGSSVAGMEQAPYAPQWNGPAESARLPARDVLIKQMAHGGDPAQMFSIGTRAAWDATAAGTMPSPNMTGSSKPEDVLEAQLDYVVHQLGGTLLEDNRVGAWVIAAGVQQRISSRSAVVFVTGQNEAEATSGPNAGSRQLRALKFYFLKDDFHRNVVACHAPELKDLMPVVERVEDNPQQLNIASLPAPLNAHPLPPLIINERGETLDEHVTRTQPNFVSALSIMIQLAQVIERLHTTGWVHRDLKPSNCLFLTQPARWALVDWACAAKAGTTSDVSFSLYYAPPESVHAYTTRQGQMQVHPSADVWSLGVMAWELFTGQKFYGPAPDLQFVMRMLSGEQPLPSEMELPADTKKRLGNSMFRATFLSMLHRDPQLRPSMRQLLSSWESFFSQTRQN